MLSYFFHRRPLLIQIALVVILCAFFTPTVHTSVETELTKWLENYDKEYTKLLHTSTLNSWNYETDLTDENQKIMLESQMKLAQFHRKMTLEAKKKFDKDKLTNPTLKKALTNIEDIGISISSDKEKVRQISNLTATMLKLYSTACFTVDGECKKLQPDGLQSIIGHSRDYEKLKTVWEGWRNVTGRKMRKDFAKWVKLSNEAVKGGKEYNDLGETWRFVYGPGFIDKVEKLLKEFEDLYCLFHSYVRGKLSEKYGAEHFKDNLIPAHLLGNMWAQNWGSIDDIVLPYKERLDVTKEMKNQDYNVSTMFHQAEHFFTSIGLKNMTQTFWDKSVFKKTPNKEMVCHASAWDLSAPGDFRIKMCTEITMDDFVTIHHEMGHIQYYLQYEDQPSYFRSGANPGFHEAVGDTLALSVSTPTHLQKLHLMKEIANPKEADINYLMQTALDKLVFVPFAYVMDKFRWNVFSGKIPESEYTAKWWEYKCKYQGIIAPVKRTEEDFDPGSKMHIAGAVPYIRYFVSYIIQFQFYKALCDKIGHEGPIHTCDFYQKPEAGKALADMLKLGSSVSWEEAMETLTGSKEMDTSAIIEYFSPLKEWLLKNTDSKTCSWNCENVIKSFKTSSPSSSITSSLKTLLACTLYVLRMMKF